MRALTAFKDALPNAINVLNANHITDINAPNNNGTTPLHWAVQKGHTEISQALIDAGADVNAKDNFGITPLNWAETTGQTELAVLFSLARPGDLKFFSFFGGRKN